MHDAADLDGDRRGSEPASGDADAPPITEAGRAPAGTEGTTVRHGWRRPATAAFASAMGWLRDGNGKRLGILSVLVVCAVAWSVRVHNIDAVGPYPIHVDEPFLADKALGILQTGDWNPHYFNYPSLPVYLAAAGIAAGSARAAAHRELRSIGDVTSTGYPAYSHPRTVRTARLLFAGISVLALLATAVAAWRLTRRAAAAPLTALLTCCSPLFLYHSWAYLNVDIVGALFVSAALAVTLGSDRDRPEAWRWWVAGVLTGLAAASKYNLGVVLGSVLLATLLLLRSGARLDGAMRVLAGFVVAFVLAVPFCILDLRAFLDGVLAELFHYATGHAGFERAAGWSHASHLSHGVIRDFGWGSVPFAAAGIAWLTAKDWRRCLVVLSFPVALARISHQAQPDAVVDVTGACQRE